MISVKMGRYYYDKKATVEDCKSISVCFIKKHGYFKRSYSSGSMTWSRNGEEVGSIGLAVNTQEKYVRFYYTYTDRQTGDKDNRDYKVMLETTACNLGGIRYWFKCPFCYKRVDTLYLYASNDFACRHCLNLSYQSRNEHSRFRAFQKLFDYEKVEEKIWTLKTKYYRGKPTRKYKQLLKKANFLKIGMGTHEELQRMLAM